MAIEHLSCRNLSNITIQLSLPRLLVAEVSARNLQQWMSQKSTAAANFFSIDMEHVRYHPNACSSFSLKSFSPCTERETDRFL
jgi:hypothetical protein